MENKSIVTKVNDRICAVEKTLTWIVFFNHVGAACHTGNLQILF